MWIKMKQNSIGPIGCFLEAQKYDLPESTLTKLSAARIRFEGTCAPWDEQRDDEAIALAAAVYDLTAASKAADEAEAHVNKLRNIAIELTRTAEASLIAAEDAAEVLAAYKGKSNTHLTRGAKRTDLMYDRDNAAAAMANACFELAKMDAEDKKQFYENTKAKHEKLENKSAKQKPETNAGGQTGKAGKKAKKRAK